MIQQVHACHDMSLYEVYYETNPFLVAIGLMLTLQIQIIASCAI